MKRNEFGAFCKVYGRTLRNKVLESILEFGELDFAISDILEEVNISKPKLYEIAKELEEEKIIKRSRMVGGTQLYVLNIRNNKVQLLIKSFNDCLKLVIAQLKDEPILAEVYIGGVNIANKLKLDGVIPT